MFWTNECFHALFLAKKKYVLNKLVCWGKKCRPISMVKTLCFSIICFATKVLYLALKVLYLVIKALYLAIKIIYFASHAYLGSYAVPFIATFKHNTDEDKMFLNFRNNNCCVLVIASQSQINKFEG